MRKTTIKRVLLPILFFMLTLPVIWAQIGETPHALVARVLFLDYATPQGQNLSDLPISNGLEVAYVRNINSFLNVAFPLHAGLANVPDYMNKRTVLGGDAVLHFQYFNEGARLVPYALIGGGLVTENFEDLGVEFPIGLGANLRVGADSYINAEASYRFSQADMRNHLKLGLGYWFTLKSSPKVSDMDGDGVPDEEDECPDIAGPANLLGCPDADGDGVVDKLDACPDMPGAVMGCPDGDGDGVADKDDKCPDEAGSLLNEGCPDIAKPADADGDGVPDETDACPNLAGPASSAGCPDSDGDGLTDNVDKCPNEAGPANMNGCPPKDSDGDGVLDNVDKCPDEAGPINMNGCPPRDSDADGVLDARDECPDTPGPINLAGCPDSDGDGVLDKDDPCPDQAGQIGGDGCPPKDSDNDGVLDGADACPNEAGPINLGGCPDSDGDGIADKDDQCPQQAGTSSTAGCPDADGDGIRDADDKCPSDFGLADFDGCPDTDGDGIPNSEDQCPLKAGSKETNGCPDTDGDGLTDDKDPCPEKAGPFNGCPDSDGDGLTDDKDHCPNSAGPLQNFGCPELEKEEKETLDLAAQAVQFETGKATLRVESYSILNKVAAILKRYPDYKLRIVGYTDNVGLAENNLRLSEERARSCYDYLVAQGIDPSRISYMGKGEADPIASNDTPQGREMNRRVEFELYTN
ncbi:MAG TPA: OmpA family protein [Phaeodactylibacter sp.]|nr:OmpA family protein [Phaeodactylibacter sp.]